MLVRIFYVLFKNFVDEFEVDWSCLLLDRILNVGFWLSSFILFFIVLEGSYKDLLNEWYLNSREVSYMFLVRFLELRVESCVNSCVRLEFVVEVEMLDVMVLFECFDLIVNIWLVEVELVIILLLCNFIEKFISFVKVLDVVLDYKLNDIEDNVFSIIIFMFIESGFILEEFVVSVMDMKDFVFFKLDLDENWLSGYFWNLIGSDLLWKM